MDELRVKFGKRLRELRLGAKLTQSVLAEQVGISVDHIGLIERGLRAPSFDVIEKLSQILEIEVFDFFKSE